MLDRIKFKFGEAPGSDPLEIVPGAMTILVGPNNSGKSLTLREIENFIKGSPILQGSEAWEKNFKIISSLRPQLPKDGSLRQSILSEIGQDIKPFRGALEAARLTPRELLARLDISQIGPLFGYLDGWGQIRTLAKEQKIDPSLLQFDTTKAEEQPSLVKAAVALLRALIEYLERHESMLNKLSTEAADEGAARLVSAQAIRMEAYLRHFRQHLILMDGSGRLGLTQATSTHSLREQPGTMMMRLFRAKDELKALREYVFDAFQKYLAIDMTPMTYSRFVLADNHPGNFEESLGIEAQQYFQQADDLASLSDGVKSYVGLHATLLSRDDRIILIDEPEAFLHPPLARRLGFNLTKLAAARNATVIAATHSPFFLMGCIEAGHPINIVRMSYRDKIPTARSISAETIQLIINDPLLRSTGVLNALFHQSAVVCEGDSDQAFYDEINERLRRKSQDGKNSGEIFARDCLFINSHGKHSVDRLMGTLRRMGIPAVGVVDLDFLKDQGLATKLLQHGGAGPGDSGSIGGHRSSVYRHFEDEARRLLSVDSKQPTEAEIKSKVGLLIKNGGIHNLHDEKAKRDLTSLLKRLKENGVFALEHGELEAWLPSLGQQSTDKKIWLEKIFEKMGSPADPATYLSPAPGDVWEFMREIARWLDAHALNVPSAEVGISSPGPL